ncbi:hypothetical protein ACFE04_019898 [Oxalis oulophora]
MEGEVTLVTKDGETLPRVELENLLKWSKMAHLNLIVGKLVHIYNNVKNSPAVPAVEEKKERGEKNVEIGNCPKIEEIAGVRPRQYFPSTTLCGAALGMVSAVKASSGFSAASYFRLYMIEAQAVAKGESGGNTREVGVLLPPSHGTYIFLVALLQRARRYLGVPLLPGGHLTCTLSPWEPRVVVRISQPKIAFLFLVANVTSCDASRFLTFARVFVDFIVRVLGYLFMPGGLRFLWCE